MIQRPPLYVFSPLPPSRNGIADYTQTLLEALQSYYECIPVISDDAPQPDWPSAMYYCEYERVANKVAECRHLYQIGNNAGHIYFLSRLERTPGLVTVHDATMAHMLEWATAHGAGGRSAYLELADASHGPEGRTLIEQTSECGLWIGSIGQELAFLSPILQPARGIIVHSRLVRQRVAASAPRVAVHLIPHFSKFDGVTTRLPGDGTFRLLCLGFPSRAKRLDLVLGAVVILRRHGIPVRLTIAGEIRPEEFDIEAQIAALSLEPTIEITGYVSEDRITELLAEADVVINLRDPTSGETSGTLSRAMAAGVCAVVSNVGTYAEYPDDTVVKLNRYQMNAAELAQCLWHLHDDPERRRNIAVSGQKFVLQTRSVDLVAIAYRDAIESAYSGVAPVGRLPHQVDLIPLRNMDKLENLAAATEALNCDFQLFWRERLLPLAAGNKEKLLVCVGLDERLERMVALGFGWLPCKASETSEIAAALVLIDEAANIPLNEQIARLVALASQLRSGGSLTVEVANETMLRSTICTKLASLGLRILRQARGPAVPLFSVHFCRSLPSGWVATFVRCAANLEPL